MEDQMYLPVPSPAYLVVVFSTSDFMYVQASQQSNENQECNFEVQTKQNSVT